MLAFGAQDCTKYKHTFDDFVELCDTIFVSQYSCFIYHHHQSLVSQLNGFGHMNPIYHKEEKDMKERAITIQFLLLSFFLVFFFVFVFSIICTGSTLKLLIYRVNLGNLLAKSD